MGGENEGGIRLLWRGGEYVGALALHWSALYVVAESLQVLDKIVADSSFVACDGFDIYKGPS